MRDALGAASVLASSAALAFGAALAAFGAAAFAVVDFAAGLAAVVFVVAFAVVAFALGSAFAGASLASAFGAALVVAFAGFCGGLLRADLQLGREGRVLGGLAGSGGLEALALGLLLVARLALGLGRALATEPDVGDAQDQQLLAMALLDPPARLGAVLERDDLVAAIPADDLGLDGRTVDHGRADGGLGAVGDEEHALQRDRLAGLDVEQLHLELGADLDAVLLPAGLDDCVHGSSNGAWRPRTTAIWDREGRLRLSRARTESLGWIGAMRQRTSTSGPCVRTRVVDDTARVRRHSRS